MFVAVAGCSASLIGLLFVALSVAPRESAPHPVVQQIRAAAAILAFINALVVSLFSLIPGTPVGYPALALGVSGVLFTAAAARSIATNQQARPYLPSQLSLMALLLAAFGVELISGIMNIGHPHETGPVNTISYVLVASLIIGIARAWELVGNRNTSLLSSLLVLAGLESAAQVSLGDLFPPPPAATPPRATPPAEPRAGPEDSGQA